MSTKSTYAYVSHNAIISSTDDGIFELTTTDPPPNALPAAVPEISRISYIEVDTLTGDSYFITILDTYDNATLKWTEGVEVSIMLKSSSGEITNPTELPTSLTSGTINILNDRVRQLDTAITLSRVGIVSGDTVTPTGVVFNAVLNSNILPWSYEGAPTLYIVTIDGLPTNYKIDVSAIDGTYTIKINGTPVTLTGSGTNPRTGSYTNP